jgi:hypothetical protein
MTFSCVPPTELVLEVADSVQRQSWQQSQQLTTANGRWTAYLNQICLDTLLPWLQDYLPEAALAPEAALWSADGLLSLWDATNGTAIQLDRKRLVLIPDKSIDTRSITVPQEWVDIPDWAGDYYLAVQVNPEGDWLRCWGYTTHEHLKTQGSYDSDDRTYTLDAAQLVADLNTFWVVRQLCPDEPTQAAIAALTALSETQAETLLQQLAQPAIGQPRLALPFEQWGALLARSTWRQRLYHLRREAQLSELQLRESQAEPTAATPQPVRLSQWLQHLFDATWQAIDNLIAQPNLAYSFRQSSDTAASQIKRAKQILLDAEANLAVVLVLILELEADGRVGVRVQLFPAAPARYLPADVQLSMRSASGELVQTVQADQQADYIQLKRFKCPPDKPFQIQVAIDRFLYTELFTG